MINPARLLALSFPLAVLMGSAVAQAQRQPAGQPAGANAAAKATSGDPLEDKLMAALATREMDGLLEYYFQKHKVPADKQSAIKGIVALRQLNDPNIPAARRRALLRDAMKGVDQFIAANKDTEALLSRAIQFFEVGMKGPINQIEYFGESPARQAELNEAAEAVDKLLDKVITEAQAQQNKLMAGQQRANDALLNQWQKLEERVQAARQNRALAAYGLALSLDPANPRRKQVADDAITFLKDFEAPEFARQHALVKMQLGKLHLAKGDHAAAVGKFAEALKVQDIDKFNTYEALYFTALAQLLAKNPAEADKAFAGLSKWLKDNLKPEEYKTVAVGVGLLEYRIQELHGELAKSPDQKKQFAQAGEAVLNRVMKENPAYAGVIQRLLLEKMPADADLTRLDPLLLRALMGRGIDEYQRAKEGVADERGKPVLARAVLAAQQLEKRKGQPNVSDDAVDEAAFLTGMFLTKLGQPAHAVEESLRYLKQYGGKHPERAQMAMNNALAAVEDLRKNPETATGQKTGELIDRTWKQAVDSGRKEYTFVYGKRLFDRKDFKNAVEVLKQTPANHPAITHARFYQLSAMQELLDEKGLNPAVRNLMVNDVQKLAAEVNQRIDADLAKAKEEQKPRLRFYKVSSTLLAADLTQKEKKHEDVLRMLQGFEQSAQGLPREENLVGTALHLRVNSLMALNRTQEAVDEVKKLVSAGSKSSASVLYNMIQEMDEEYAQAREANDREAMRANSAAQVALIGPLIQQTQDPKAKAAYEKWEAQLLLRAARNETADARRTQYLTDAQKVFARQLGSTQPETPEHDNLRYQLALISYELKDHKRVQQELGQLLAAGKLGKPELRDVNPDGTEQFKENPVYWEGLLRFMQANWEVAQADKSQGAQDALENSRDVLKTLYINRGSNVGGRLAAEYQQLKAKLLPGFDETKIAPATTQQASAAE